MVTFPSAGFQVKIPKILNVLYHINVKLIFEEFLQSVIATSSSVGSRVGGKKSPKSAHKTLTATHCNTLQYTVARCSTLQRSATHCNTLHHTKTHCNTQQTWAMREITVQHIATRGNTLQHTATHSNTLQHTATHCNTLQHTAEKTGDAQEERRTKECNVCSAVLGAAER